MARVLGAHVPLALQTGVEIRAAARAAAGADRRVR